MILDFPGYKILKFQIKKELTSVSQLFSCYLKEANQSCFNQIEAATGIFLYKKLFLNFCQVSLSSPSSAKLSVVIKLQA